MEREKKLLEELKSAYPRYEISMLPTKQRGDRKLVVVKDLEDAGDVDDWTVDRMYPVWWHMRDILANYENGMRDFRLLFICDNQFMLWSPDVGTGNVFREFKKPLRKEVYGYEAQQRYIGECKSIQDVIDYLTETTIWF